MKRILLRYFTLMLLVANTLPVLAPAALLLRKWATREEMEERLEAERLTSVSTHHQNVQWLDDHECLIGGRLFDVKTVTRHRDTVVLEGIFDDAETEIEEALAEQGAPDTNGESAVMFKFTQLKASPLHALIYVTSPNTIHIRTCIAGSSSTLSRPVNVPTQPPRA
jgi:hypothetical protein